MTFYLSYVYIGLIASELNVGWDWMDGSLCGATIGASAMLMKVPGELECLLCFQSDECANILQAAKRAFESLIYLVKK